jgi:hypothetical protein
VATLAQISRPEIADELVKLVRQGVPISRAARLAGVSSQVLSEWKAVAEGRPTWRDGTPVTDVSRNKIVTLFGRLAHAEAECARELVAGIQEAAKTANAKTGVPEWRAGAWLLNNHPAFRQEFHEHREVTVESNVNVTTERRYARALSPEELRQIVDGEAKLLPESASSTPSESDDPPAHVSNVEDHVM